MVISIVRPSGLAPIFLRQGMKRWCRIREGQRWRGGCLGITSVNAPLANRARKKKTHHSGNSQQPDQDPIQSKFFPKLGSKRAFDSEHDFDSVASGGSILVKQDGKPKCSKNWSWEGQWGSSIETQRAEIKRSSWGSHALYIFRSDLRPRLCLPTRRGCALVPPTPSPSTSHCTHHIS